MLWVWLPGRLRPQTPPRWGSSCCQGCRYGLATYAPDALTGPQCLFPRLADAPQASCGYKSLLVAAQT